MNDNIMYGYLIAQFPTVQSLGQRLTRTVIPRMLIINPDLTSILTVSKDDLFGDWGDASAGGPDVRVFVAPREIDRLKLREGDFVVYNASLSQVLSVNGIPVDTKEGAAFFAKRVNLMGPKAVKPRYPRRIMSCLYTYGKRTVLALATLAPVGWGHNVFIAAQPKTGKSRITREALDALCKEIKSNPDSNKKIVLSFVGERGPDTSEWIDIVHRYWSEEELAQLTAEGKAPVAFFMATSSDDLRAQVEVAMLAYSYAHNLVACGYDTVLFVDSVSRLVLSDSRAADIAKAGGMAAMGMHTASLAKVSQVASVAGEFQYAPGKWVALTIFHTVLAPSADPAMRSSEAAFFGDAAPGLSTVIWRLGYYTGTPYPWIDVVNTGSREEERLFEDAIGKSILENTIAPLRNRAGIRIGQQGKIAPAMLLQNLMSAVDTMHDEQKQTAAE